MKYLFFIFLSLIYLPAYAQDINDTASLYAQVQYKQQQVNSLKSEIEKLDMDLIGCKKNKNGWTIGTIVGSVGTIATATGALVQTNKINQAKKAGKTEQQKEKKDNKNQSE